MTDIKPSERVLATEWNTAFIERMKNSMVVSYYKYGPLRDAYPEKINAIESLKVRLAAYERTGNADFLVDVANFALIEATAPRHPKAHYAAQDSSASPGRVNADGRRTHENNAGEDLKGGYENKSSVANLRSVLGGKED